MASLDRSGLIDAQDQLVQCLYLFSVFFSCLIFKLTRKQRLVAEFLDSLHIQYEILCYSVILIAVLIRKDKIRASHKPTVCSLYFVWT